jgi:hypothetical protein
MVGRAIACSTARSALTWAERPHELLALKSSIWKMKAFHGQSPASFGPPSIAPENEQWPARRPIRNVAGN